MEAVILAGGLGTRLRSLVADLPKPMAPVEGRPFLEHLLDYWIGQGVKRFVISVGYRREAIMSHFGGAYAGAGIDYAVEESPLGTGGGLLVALERLSGKEAFLAMNGDTWFEVDLRSFVAFHEAARSDWTFALFPTSDDRRYMAMDIGPEGRVRSFSTAAPGARGLANGGVYLIRPEAVRSTGWKPGESVSLENELAPAVLAANRRVFGFECANTFVDIGLPDDYLRAPRLLAH